MTPETKFEITYNGDVIRVPGEPDQILFFDTKPEAEQFIVDHELPADECQILALVIYPE